MPRQGNLTPVTPGSGTLNPDSPTSGTSTPKSHGHGTLTPLGRKRIQPGLIASTTILYPMTPSSFGQIILNFTGSATVVYGPTPKLLSFTVGFISTTTSVKDMVIGEGGFFVPYVASTTQVYGPSAASLTFTAPFIASVSTTFAPTATDQTFTLGFISTVSAIYALLASDEPTISPPFISSHTTLYAIPAIQQFPVGFIATVSAAYAPTAVNQRVAAGFITSSTTTYALTAAFRTVIVPFRPSHTLTFAPISLLNNQVTVGFISSHTTTSALVVGRSWPASFYTGPLGTGNVLPNTTSGAFLASQFGGVGYVPSQQRAQIVSRQTAMGRTYDVIMHHYDGAPAQSFDGVAYCEDPFSAANTPNGVTQEQYAINNGSYCAVSWSPNATIADINAGALDAAFQKYGSYWATYAPNKIMLRMFWEFDLNGFVWSIYGQGGSYASPLYSAAEFISAWRRCVQNVQAGGGTSVGFWWCPFEGGGAGGQAGRQIQANYYPGDSYVDWVGSDLYNGPFQSSPLHSGNADWWEQFNYSAPGVTTSPSIWSDYDLFSSGLAVSGQRGFTGTPRIKPFMVGEHSSTYFTADANAKKNHWLNVTAAARGIGSMGNCIGIAFFDEDVHSPFDYDWRIDSNAAVVNVAGSSDANTLAGFVSMGQNVLMRGKA